MPSQLRACFSQRSDHLIFALCYFLASRDGLLIPRVNRFQGNQVSVPDGGNLGYHQGFESLSFTYFDAQFLRHPLVWIMPHHAQCLADVRFREEAQKRGLGKFDLEGFVQ